MLSIAHKAPASGTLAPALLAAASTPAIAPSLLLEPLSSLAMIMDFDRDDEIIYQGEAAKYCFELVSGCVRTVRLLNDGRRQVGEFLLPGDALGFETARQHEFGAEAVTPTTLRRYRASAIEERADRDLAFAQRLRRHSASEVRAARARLILLGRKTACERIASFLLEMHERLHAPARGVLALPMSRCDIADYLGLTIETVCRGLTELRHRGVIGVDRTRISILDHAALVRAGSDQLN